MCSQQGDFAAQVVLKQSSILDLEFSLQFGWWLFSKCLLEMCSQQARTCAEILLKIPSPTSWKQHYWVYVEYVGDYAQMFARNVLGFVLKQIQTRWWLCSKYLLEMCSQQGDSVAQVVLKQSNGWWLCSKCLLEICSQQWDSVAQVVLKYPTRSTNNQRQQSGSDTSPKHLTVTQNSPKFKKWSSFELQPFCT